MIQFSLSAQFNEDKIIEYKKIGDVSLKLRVFMPNQHKVTNKAPAIVFFFGGGWVGFNPTHLYKHSRYLANKGVVAICADYRTRKAHGTTPMECLKDAKSAMRRVRIHAQEFGVNPDEVAAGGASAGGHLEAATATVKGFNEAGEDTSVSCIPKALVLFNPVYDNSKEGFGYGRIKDYWKEFSPMHNLSKNCPPTIVFLGTKDTYIPVVTAEKYKAILDSYKVRNELHLYEEAIHGFFNKKDYFDDVAQKSEEFLKSLKFIR